MNWLAHIFLSEQNIDFQIGNYLADPLKAKAWNDASENLKKGMKTHILIDSFSDKHTLVLQSKNRLAQKGLLRAIVIDIVYDHFLTKNWDRFCNISFENYTQNFYEEASKRLKDLPNNASQRLSRIIKYEVLNKYQSINDLKKVFKGIDENRLSPKLLSRDSASAYFDTFQNNMDDIEKDFLAFFPELCEKVKENIDKNKINHWKI